jgi:DNA polymerase-4
MKVAGDARWPHIIAHADMDAFYASVEQLDNPELRGKPVLVGPRSQRGVVLTASYEARPFGCGSAMPMAEAIRRCPHAVIVPPRFERYTAVSARIMHVFDGFSPRVEPVSLDEAFIDMSGAEDLFGSPEQMGRKIKAAVKAATGLNVTVGIASTKHVAKIASALHKPDGLTVVNHAQTAAWLAPLAVKRMWGVGPKMEARLHALGFRTIGDLARADPRTLASSLGRHGSHLHQLALGLDPRHVENSRRERSIGSERTLETDVRSLDDISVHLRRAADRVSTRLRNKRLHTRGVRVKLKTTGFQLHSRQVRLDPPTDLGEVLFRAGVQLATDMLEHGPFRLVGLAAFDLAPADADTQLDLFTEPPRQSRLETTLDELNRRFGRIAIRRARDLGKAGTVMGTAPTLDFRAERPPDEEPPRDRSLEGEDPGWS